MDTSFATILRPKRNNSASSRDERHQRGYGRKMGYKPRSFYPGTATHLTAHGVDDEPLFRSDLDRYELLARI